VARLCLTVLASLLSACAGILGGDPLLEAAEQGDVAAVTELLDAGADVNAYRDDLGRTPLHVAAWYGRTSVVELLIARGAEVDRRTGERSPDYGPNRRETALMRAAGWGHLETVRVLLAAGADASARNTNGETPLHFAVCAHGADVPAVVELLIDAGGADPNAVDRWRRTPLERLGTCRRAEGSAEVIARLIVCGARPRDVKAALDNVLGRPLGTDDRGMIGVLRGFDTPALEPARWERVRSRGSLADYQAYLAHFPGGEHADEARAFIADQRFKAAQDRDDAEGWWAYLTGHPGGMREQQARQRLAELTPPPRSPEEAERYLARLPDGPYRGRALQVVEAQARRDRSQQMIRAALAADVDAVRKLVAAGVDIDAKSPEGETALIVAARGGFVLTPVTTSAGGLVIQDFHVVREKHRLSTAAHRELVEILLQHRADTRIRDRSGLTALDHARLGLKEDASFGSIVELLRR
jgi:hypothetical protein